MKDYVLKKEQYLTPLLSPLWKRKLKLKMFKYLQPYAKTPRLH